MHPMIFVTSASKTDLYEFQALTQDNAQTTTNASPPKSISPDAILTLLLEQYQDQLIPVLIFTASTSLSCVDCVAEFKKAFVNH